MNRDNCAASTGTACGTTPIPQVLHKMPPKRPFSLSGTQRQRATRIEHLEATGAPYVRNIGPSSNPMVAFC